MAKGRRKTGTEAGVGDIFRKLRVLSEGSPQILRGASSSRRIGWLRKISRDLRHRPRISFSVSCTFFPGREPCTGYGMGSWDPDLADRMGVGSYKPTTGNCCQGASPKPLHQGLRRQDPIPQPPRRPSSERHGCTQKPVNRSFLAPGPLPRELRRLLTLSPGHPSVPGPGERSKAAARGVCWGGAAVATGPHGLSPPKRRWPPGAAGPPARHFRTARGPGSGRAHLPSPCPPSSRRPMMESRLSFSLSDMAAPPLRASSSGPSPASRPLAASFRPGSPSARPSPPPALCPASWACRPSPPHPWLPAL